jgi:hypothetical protein
MSVFFTCGHNKNGDRDGYTVSVKRITNDNRKEVDYRTICYYCFKVYEDNDLLLYGEQDVRNWLDDEEQSFGLGELYEKGQNKNIYIAHQFKKD